MQKASVQHVYLRREWQSIGALRVERIFSAVTFLKAQLIGLDKFGFWTITQLSSQLCAKRVLCCS